MMSLRRSYDEPKKPKDWLRLPQFLRVPVVRRKHQGRERIAPWFFSWRPIEWNESIHLFFFYFLIASDSTPTVQVRQFKVELTCFFCALLDALLGSVCVCLSCGCTHATRQSQGCKTNPMKKQTKKEKKKKTANAWSVIDEACLRNNRGARTQLNRWAKKKKERPYSTPIATWNSFFFSSSSLDYNKKYKPAASFENDITTSFFNWSRLFFLLRAGKRQMEDDDKYF